MKAARLSAACAAIALLPLATLADDTKSSTTATGSETRKNFDKLDNDRDGRLSKMEAGSDAKLEFTRVDMNGDGFIDRMEYMRRDGAQNSSKEAVPSSQSPQSSSPNSPGTSSKTDPNQPQGAQPSGNRPRN